MTEFTLHLPDPETQQRLGAGLGQALFAALPGRSQALVVFLQGDLGTGKTTLVRGMLRGLGYQDAVRSPTFTLVEPYEIADGRVYHLDLYRLGDGEELEYLGLRDMLAEPALVLIEWPERGAGWLPAADLRIELQHAPGGRDLRLRTQAALIDRIGAVIQEFESEVELKN